jgi:hypothetical protein
MALKQVLEILDLLDTATIDAAAIHDYFMNKGLDESEIDFQKVNENKGETLFIKIHIKGSDTQSKGKKSPTLGIIGQLGGIGARPHKIGLVSDADGAISALAAAAKIAEMRARGDRLKGNVIVSTHLCPNSPMIPHEPVPFMGSPISIETMNAHEIDSRMEAILSIDTTKGNRVINQKGFAISPTVKDGYILRVSEDLMDIMQNVTGKLPVVFPITTQDITPVSVPGCATGANHPMDIEAAVRFIVEVAKAFGEGECSFYDDREFQKIIDLYGSLEHLRTLGR